MHTALTALEASGLPPDTLRLGDRDDRSAAGKERALLRHAHINATHVPDIYRLGQLPWCWEYKCWSFVLVEPQHSGRFSTADGWFLAFGGTAEKAVYDTLGVAERGAPGTTYDRHTGEGHVKAHDGDYADALSKGYGVTLVCAEPSGAITAAFDALLRRYGRLSVAPGVVDYTQYGLSSSSPRDYYQHHLAAHAAAVTFADVHTILNDVAHKNFLLTL